MGIIGFHRFLISTAILFCLGFAGWEFAAYSDGASTGALALALVFVAFAIGLGIYLANLNRILHRNVE
ncbi:MAG: hypothetical protein ACE5FP_09295 [Gemmatimonadota bacterium]